LRHFFSTNEGLSKLYFLKLPISRQNGQNLTNYFEKAFLAEDGKRHATVAFAFESFYSLCTSLSERLKTVFYLQEAFFLPAYSLVQSLFDKKARYFSNN
jgi:hypothetical protein